MGWKGSKLLFNVNIRMLLFILKDPWDFYVKLLLLKVSVNWTNHERKRNGHCCDLWPSQSVELLLDIVVTCDQVNEWKKEKWPCFITLPLQCYMMSYHCFLYVVQLFFLALFLQLSFSDAVISGMTEGKYVPWLILLGIWVHMISKSTRWLLFKKALLSC